MRMEEELAKEYTKEQVEELGKKYSECKKIVEHLLDTRGMNDMDRVNFYMNIYISDCILLGITQEEFAKINKMAYEIHLKLKPTQE